MEWLDVLHYSPPLGSGGYEESVATKIQWLPEAISLPVCSHHRQMVDGLQH
jgi:hypothetical protein